MDDLLLRIFLPIYMILYLYILYFHKIASFKKKYNQNPLAVEQTDRVQSWLETLKKFMFLLLFICVLFFYTLFPEYYWILCPIEYLQSEYIVYPGISLLVFSVVLIRLAQDQLKSSWRIGVKHFEKTELITDGIYSVSRNPINLGIRLSLVGMFLALPNILTFSIMIVGNITGEIRVIIEEEHLANIHGDRYDMYCKKTRKWL